MVDSMHGSILQMMEMLEMVLKCTYGSYAEIRKTSRESVCACQITDDGEAWVWGEDGG